MCCDSPCTRSGVDLVCAVRIQGAEPASVAAAIIRLVACSSASHLLLAAGTARIQSSRALHCSFQPVFLIHFSLCLLEERLPRALGGQVTDAASSASNLLLTAGTARIQTSRALRNPVIQHVVAGGTTAPCARWAGDGRGQQSCGHAAADGHAVRQQRRPVAAAAAAGA